MQLTDAVSTLLAGGRTAVGCGGRSRTRIFLVNSQAHYHAFACATPQCGTQIVKDQRGFPLRWCVRVSNPAGPRAAWVTATPVSLSVYRTMLYVKVLNVQSPDFLSAPATSSTLVLLTFVSVAPEAYGALRLLRSPCAIILRGGILPLLEDVLICDGVEFHDSLL